MSILIRNLSKHYITGGKKNIVLHKINLNVNKGEIFVLSGPNGSGKTTFLKILSTLVLPDAGNINICGIDAIKEPCEVRKRVGLVHDVEKSFYQVLNIEENMKFYSKLYGISRNDFSVRLDELLVQFKIRTSIKTKLHHCSSGTKQKLAIVRALLGDPDVILIDELTKSLDGQSKKQIADYIKNLVVLKNKACIVVTHESERLEEIGDYFGCLNEGVIK